MKENEQLFDIENIIQNSNEYWSHFTTDDVERVRIPYDFSEKFEYKKSSYTISLNDKSRKVLNDISGDNDILMYIIFLAGLSIQVYKYTGYEKSVIGIPVYEDDIEDNIVINNSVLPLKFNLNDNISIKELIINLKNGVLEIYKNQYCNLDNILKNSNIGTNVMELTPISIYMNSLHKSKHTDYICNSNKNEITICIDKNDNESINLSFVYNSSLFKKEIIELFGQNYTKIINEMVSNFDKKVKDINIITEEERRKILFDFNDTKIEYPKDKTIQDLFEEQVEKTPNNIAVVFEDKQLTYRELNEKSNQLARVLRNKGVQAESIIGIMMERSLDIIIGIMGILKAGGAYLPIDTSYPKDRIEYIIEDATVDILVSSYEITKNLDFRGQTVDITDKGVFDGEKRNLQVISKNSDLAYVIYTSGSTGNPKGVMIEHKSLINYIYFCKTYYGENKIGDFPLFTSVSFDLTVTSIYTPLLLGKTIRVYSDKDNLDIQHIIEDKLDIMKLTPAHLSIISELNTEKIDISKFIVGGEELSINLARKISRKFNRKVEIINEYGPTEATVGCIVYKYEELDIKEKTVPIGLPINNTRVYIIDKSLNIVPIGVPGELCIAGDGLARGYLNRPELTAEKFIESPFEPGQRIYKTGDLVRWLPDGKIEFLGRIDNQVKIRGFRIELGEIENRLLSHENIKEAVVLARENQNNEKYLCAYIVCNKDKQNYELREYLKGSLPEYMIPSYFVDIDTIPLTTNGKIDRKALPEPNINELLASKYEAPRNEIEEKLVEIWCEVLGVEKIGIDDNFFELGGHSLKGIVIISKIHKELNVEVSLEELFKSPTIKMISESIIKSDQSENLFATIERVDEKEYYEVASAQKRIYILQQFNKNSKAYNMPIVYELEGEINKERIENTFKKLVLRHDVLRTYFEAKEDQIVQKIDNESEFKMMVRREDEEEFKNIIKNFVTVFELEKGPLFRAEIIENHEKTYLLIDMHHIISDGVSMSILMKEFVALYNGEELLPLRIQYKDFAEWQNKFLKSEEMKKQEEYWVNRFNDDIPLINLPYDYERPKIQSFEGDIIYFNVDEETTKALGYIAKENTCTIHMVLLSAFNILLSKYSRQEDIVVGTPIAGRPHADLQNIMGMFVNTLPLRNRPSGEKTYIEFLKEVKENSLKAYANQSYQVEELIDKVNVRRDSSRNPLFDVIFNMTNIDYGTDLELKGVVLKQKNNETKVAKMDLTLTAVEYGKTLALSFEYCTKLFKEETIKRMCNNYVETLKNICENTKIKLSEIEVIKEEEKQQILYDFNETKMDYPKDKTIQELFEEQVEKTPDNIAVVFEDKQLTYKELNEKSNQLARVLRNKGIGSDHIVGIMVDRSLEMIIGIMGILKSGGAYLPIDAKYPKDRIEYMIKDSNVGTVIATSEVNKNFEFSGNLIDLTDENICKENDSNLELINNCNDLAYVIYTSGSTGNPKGVMIEHRQVNNFSQGITKETDLKKHKSILCITTISFDIFGLETLVPLMQGLSIIVASEEQHIDGDKLGQLIEKSNLDVMQLTPTRLNMLLGSSKFKSALNGIKTIIVGGEELLPNIVEDLKDYKELEIFNVYGPTETTIWSTVKLIQKDEKITIGKPISNTEIYILNQNNQIVPVGVPGELCIGGDGLARGYLNRPELTSEKFINNPFNSEKKIYKTGDLARWLSDGNIEFLGRMDNQVKIRGFRIELGEIENRLACHENIKEAVVLSKDNNKYLCAYIVADKELNTRELREYMKETLPEYMTPAHFVQIDEMPLTLNGKINRKALLNIEVKNESENRVLPRSLQENLIAEIWKDILGINEVYIYDDFFEIGGNSINIIQIANEIANKLNVEVNPADLMINTTVAELSEHIMKNDSCNKYKHIFKINNSSSDKKIFILHGGDADIFYYRHLAKLLEDKYSVYGIQPKGLNGRESLPESYFEMLRDYIREIRLIQSEGPYIFAGYCVGGYLAFDIASIFEMQGEKVGALIEIDQEPFVEKKIYWKVRLFRRILKGVDFFRRITRKDKNYTLERFTSIMEKKHEISKERQMEIISDRKNIFNFFCMELLGNCNYCYLAKKVKTPTLVVKAKENDNKLFEDESWENMTDKDLEFYEIEGGHKTLLLPPYVDKLGEIILDYLSRTVEE